MAWRASAGAIAGPGCLTLGLIAVALPLAAQLPAADTSALAHGPGSRMTTLFEKTIFKVDVLTLEVRFDRTVAEQLGRLVATGERDRSVEDSIAATAIAARDVWAQMVFHRNVKLNQFLDGLVHNARRARDAGILDGGTYATIEREAPVWYAALADRNIREGDVMTYRIRGDTLRTIVRGVEGRVYVDQTDIGPGRVLSVLGGYFAPGSDFRKGLIRSIFPP